jgi:hypothetical protein
MNIPPQVVPSLIHNASATVQNTLAALPGNVLKSSSSSFQELSSPQDET